MYVSLDAGDGDILLGVPSVPPGLHEEISLPIGVDEHTALGEDEVSTAAGPAPGWMQPAQDEVSTAAEPQPWWVPLVPQQVQEQQIGGVMIGAVL